MHWIFKNKDQGKTAAAASLGMITLWDVEGGLPQIDKYLYSKDNHVVAGAPDLALPVGGSVRVWRLGNCSTLYGVLSCQSQRSDALGLSEGAGAALSAVLDQVMASQRCVAAKLKAGPRGPLMNMVPPSASESLRASP